MGKLSFLPGGLLQTAAQAQAAGRRNGMRTGRRRKKRANGARKRTRRASNGARRAGTRRKPRPGTKAWMAYIRGLRRK